MKRRTFIKYAGASLALAALSKSTFAKSLEKYSLFNINGTDYDWENIRGDLEYKNIAHDVIRFSEISEGLGFSRVNVKKQGKLVDRIAIAKINPRSNKIRVFSAYNEETNQVDPKTIQDAEIVKVRNRFNPLRNISWKGVIFLIMTLIIFVPAALKSNEMLNNDIFIIIYISVCVIWRIWLAFL